MGVTEPSRLPLYYFGFAHLALAGAGLILATHSELLSGFFYQAPLMAPLHLLTLGWISGSILGALYMVAPMALRTRLPESRVDMVVCFAYALGFSGMVSHFWLDTWSGMLWSTLLVVATFLFVGWRVLTALRSAPVALGVKLHMGLAFLNVLVAAGLAMVMAYNKVAEPLVPVVVLDGVYAHFHLAALGWAAMMVMGVGYRLLPMLLPAAMPQGVAPVASAVLVEVGTLGLAWSFLGRPELRGLFALVAALGLLVFLGRIALLLRQRKPRARGLPRPDFGLLHVGQAMLYLLLSLSLGLALAFELPGAEQRFRLVPVYAVLALVGFLAQMVLGVGARLLPLYAWFRAFAELGGEEPPPPPYSATKQAPLAGVLLLWTTAVPLLAGGLYLERPALVAGAGVAILGTALVAAGHFVAIFRDLARPRP